MATLESLLVKVGIDPSSISSDMRNVGTEIRRGADRIDGTIAVTVDDDKIRGGMSDVESSVERMIRDIDGDVPVDVDDSKVKGGLSDVESTVERKMRDIDSDVPIDVDDSKVTGGLNDVESMVERKMRDIDGDVPVGIDDDKVRGGLSDVESTVERTVRAIDGDVPVGIDDDKVRGDLNGVESTVERMIRDIDSDVPVMVDDSKVKGDLNGVESTVERTMRTIDSDVPVTIDSDKLRGDLNGVESTVERKMRSIDADVPVGIDEDHIRRELSAVETSVNRRVRAMDPDIDVDVDRDRVMTSFTGLSAKLKAGAVSTGLFMGRAIGSGIALAFAGGAVVGALIGKSAFDEAQEAQKIGEQTEAVIKSTGHAAHVTAGQISELTEALSLKSGIDDEEIQTGANMLLTFKNIQNQVGKTNDIFDQATKATLDMSVAMDMPMKNAAIMLGKALNDPIAGLSAMSRVGITFTAQQEKQITALVESGKTMKAQKIILGELTSEFGGSAAAQATAADKAKVAWGNLMEQLGTKMMPVLNRLLQWFVSDIVPALQRFGSWFDAEVVPAIKSFIDYVQTNWPKISKTIMQGVHAVEPIIRSLIDIIRGVIVIIVAIWRKWGDDIMRFAKVAFTFIVGLIRNQLKIIQGVVDVFAGILTGDWSRVWKGLKEILGGVWGNIKNVIKLALGVIRELIRSGWDAIKDLTKAAWNAFVNVLQRAWDNVKRDVSNAVGKVRDLVSDAWGKIRDLTSTAWNKVRDVVDGVWDKIRDLVSNAAGKVRDVVSNAWEKVRDLTSTAWNKVRDVVDNVWDKIRDVVSNAAGRVRDVVSNAWDKIRDVTSTLWGRIRDAISNVWDRIRDVVSNAAGRVRDVVSNAWDRIRDVTSNAWTRIRDVIGNVWDRIRDVVSNAVGRVRDVVSSAWDRLRDATGNAWGRIADVIGNAWDRIRGIFDRLKDAAGNIPDAFSRAKEALARIWDGIKGAIARPVDWIIDVVYNNGIRKALNWIPGVNLQSASGIPGYAKGGWTGPGGEKKPAGLVHADEFVVKKRSRLSLEQDHPGLLDYMNRTGRWPGAVNQSLGYKEGGQVKDRAAAALRWARGEVGKPYVWGGVGPGGYDCSGFMSAITNFLRGNSIHSRVGTTASFPWSGFKPGGGIFTIGSTPNYGGSGVGHMAGTLGGVNVESSGGVGVRVGSSARGAGNPHFTEHGHLGEGDFGLSSGFGIDIGLFDSLFGSGNATSGTFMGAADAVPKFIHGLEDIWDKIHSMDSRGPWWKMLSGAPASVMDEVKSYGLDKLKDAGAWGLNQLGQLAGQQAARAKGIWDTISGIDLPSFGLSGGGVVTRPRLAMLAERGPEAVVPLPRGLVTAISRTGSGDVASMGHSEATNALLERIAVAVESGGEVLIDGKVLAGEVTRRQRANQRGQRVAAGTASWST